jgi:hypothetical protein
MSDYSQKRIELDPDARIRVTALVSEINNGLRELGEFIVRAAGIPVSREPAITRYELRPDVTFSDSGVVIVPLPTDPPMFACGYYTDGEYTNIVVPCTEIVLPSGTTIGL